MSVPSSVEELLQLIRKSGMVDEQKLSGYLQRRTLGRGPLPADAREAADVLVHDGVLTNFQAEQFLLGKWRGFTIGKYKLLERVGVGGMGQVFLCEHMFMKRRVAVKVLPPAKAEQPAALGRFYREARAAGSLDHPNIVRTHDIDQDGNLHFIVMEYVDGSNLLEMVKKFGPMDLRRACSYVRQVALGLDFAFKAGLIHRDVKPGNILIDRKGVARVLDMGLARFYKDTTDLLTVKYDDKIVLGTADYVAPEQVANSHNVDVRADIYGLGATLYFLLAGHPPFPTGTVSQKLLWHRTKEPTPVRQVRPEVPEELAAIVARMMAKDPAKRFQTPGEVAQALAAWVPAGVPQPVAAEMPQMCPAVREVLDTTADASAELVPAPAEEPVAVGAAAEPVGRTLSAVGPSPFGAPGSASRPVRPAGTPVPAGPHPFRPQPGTGTAPVYAPATLGYDPTPMPGGLLSPEPAPFAEPEPAAAGGRTGYRVMLYVLLAASVLIGGGLVAVKLMHGN
jgi:serine/threonine protein kinase